MATEKEIGGVTVTDKRSEHCEKVLNKLTPGNHSEGLKEASEVGKYSIHSLINPLRIEK